MTPPRQWPYQPRSEPLTYPLSAMRSTVTFDKETVHPLVYTEAEDKQTFLRHESPVPSLPLLCLGPIPAQRTSYATLEASSYAGSVLTSAPCTGRACPAPQDGSGPTAPTVASSSSRSRSPLQERLDGDVDDDYELDGVIDDYVVTIKTGEDPIHVSGDPRLAFVPPMPWQMPRELQCAPPVRNPPYVSEGNLNEYVSERGPRPGPRNPCSDAF